MALVAVGRELQLTWGFVRYDFSATVIPASFMMVAAARLGGGATTTTLLLGAFYFLLYVYTFAVSNQIIGVEEDRRNKPDRPIAAGVIALRGAWGRWLVAMVLFPVVGAALGVAEWALLWQLCFCLYNFGGFARHWATKSLVMGVGLVAQLAAAWSVVGPMPGIAWQWISGLAVVAFVHCNIQDLRDVAGDRVLGRRTLPIVYGMRRTCFALAVLFGAGLPLIAHGWLFAPLRLGWGVALALVVLDGLSLWIAARLLLDTRPKALHRSYMLFTYWYCLALASAALVLPGAV